jgi:glyoxylase-like metal-dependent hydrolase (beta-lactamase superfamily II)
MSGVNRSFKVGRATVTCVDEWTVAGQNYSKNFSPYSKALFDQRKHLLPPGHSTDDDGMVAKIQNWLIQVDGRNIIIDTGFGNGKDLPGLGSDFSFLNTDFLKNLSSTGVQPEDVDAVIVTHIHVDHVGWNTYRNGNEWIPTFANARHIFTRVEREYWDTTLPNYNPAPAARILMQNCFEESVLPIFRNGLADTAEMDDRIDDLFRFVPSPGHTQGQAAVKFVCDGEGVLFCGDTMHHPIQLLIPEWNIVWDQDPITSVKSRRKLLDLCADENLILAPAHFPRQACRVSRNGEFFLPTNLDMT